MPICAPSPSHSLSPTAQRIPNSTIRSPTRSNSRTGPKRFPAVDSQPALFTHLPRSSCWVELALQQAAGTQTVRAGQSVLVLHLGYKAVSSHKPTATLLKHTDGRVALTVAWIASTNSVVTIRSGHTRVLELVVAIGAACPAIVNIVDPHVALGLVLVVELALKDCEVVVVENVEDIRLLLLLLLLMVVLELELEDDVVLLLVEVVPLLEELGLDVDSLLVVLEEDDEDEDEGVSLVVVPELEDDVVSLLVVLEDEDDEGVDVSLLLDVKDDEDEVSPLVVLETVGAVSELLLHGDVIDGFSLVVGDELSELDAGDVTLVQELNDEVVLVVDVGEGEDEASLEDEGSVEVDEVEEDESVESLENMLEDVSEDVLDDVDEVVEENVDEIVKKDVSVKDEEEFKERLVDEDVGDDVVEDELSVGVLDAEVGRGVGDKLSEDVEELVDEEDDNIDVDIEVKDKDPIDGVLAVDEVTVAVLNPPVHDPTSLSVIIVTPPIFVRVFGELVISRSTETSDSHIQ
ncbi:hypothetical protein PSPO01_10283 [Paraphaeosphaeria sporulosa]